MAENKGGYDVEFLHEQFDDMKCSICLLILREPMQADECGHRFCKSCVVNIEKSGQKKYICPQDRTKMSLFRDKGREREILNRPVKCIHHKEGCCWANALRELENHKKVCDFEEIVCPFNDCGDRFQRRFLAKHNKEDCLYRTMLCPFCDEEYSFHLEQEHIVECVYLPICCDYCQAQEIPRYKMETHLIQKCAKAPTECGFAHLGCEKRMLMYDIGKHNQNFSVQHMNLALQKIHEQQSEIRKMADDLQNQKAEIMRLNESLLTECWKTNVTKSDRHLWKIMGFSNEVKKVHEWKRDNIQTISFYTFQGYHIKVDLYPNYRSGKHLAIFAYTVVGEFDEDLKWPMDKTTLKFTVLIKDRRSWATVYRITTDKNHYKIAAFQKPPHIAPCFGTTQFIKHRSLSEFLYNDSLTIK
uniref:Uncharacterized protein n=1 Tax=Clytia hemisphaerica TaxID=252671 RepID=A0A7M5UGY2_9CNID